MDLYIIRHGEATGQGVNSDLTERGNIQVKLLGERMRNYNIEKIYVSPYLRALKTALPVYENSKHSEIEIVYDLMEKGTPPEYCGSEKAEIQKIFPDAKIGKQKCLGIETNEISLQRAKKVIDYIKTDSKNRESIAVVAHGTFNTFLISAAANLPVYEKLNFSQDNTGVTLIKYIVDKETEKTKIYYTNDIRHIPMEIGTEGVMR